MPLMTDAYLADTTHLNAQEHGAYLLLLIVAWRSKRLRLPDDDKLLARYAKVDPRTWVRIKPTIMAFWELVDGFWTQKKQQKVWEIVSKRVESSRANGRGGGRPKSLKNNETPKPTGSENETQKNLSKTKPTIVGEKEEAKASSKSRGSRLPEDWAPSPRLISWAVAEGLSESEARREAEKFRGYWLNETGQRASKIDWNRAYQTWVRNEVDNRRKRKGSSTRDENGDLTNAVLFGRG